MAATVTRQHGRSGRDASVPPGWSSNPSAWRERLPLLGLAAVGFCAALYIGLTQIGALPTIWDPFFGSASAHAVTHSAFSRALPVPDGFLGVAGYLGDLFFGGLGGADRWHRAPWIVLAFGVVITCLALVGIGLTLLQATVIGHWCTVCLVSATVSVLIFILGFREPLASAEGLAKVSHERGWGAAWHALWTGFDNA